MVEIVSFYIRHPFFLFISIQSVVNLIIVAQFLQVGISPHNGAIEWWIQVSCFWDRLVEGSLIHLLSFYQVDSIVSYSLFFFHEWKAHGKPRRTSPEFLDGTHGKPFGRLSGPNPKGLKNRTRDLPQRRGPRIGSLPLELTLGAFC